MKQTIDVQVVFNKVIASGDYERVVIGLGLGMCAVIRQAKYLGYAEAEAAQDAVDAYLDQVAAGYGYLASALAGELLTADGIRCMYDETLAIYKDWANRPMEPPLAKYKEVQA